MLVKDSLVLLNETHESPDDDSDDPSARMPCHTAGRHAVASGSGHHPLPPKALLASGSMP